MDKHQKNRKKNAKAVNGRSTVVSVKKPHLSIQKRNELKSLTGKLLKICTQPLANNINEQWTQYLEIQKILEKVIALEAPLKIKNQSSRLDCIESFFRWATDNGVQYEGITISEFPGYGLGLEATRDFKKGEPLISIPRKLIISEEYLPDGVSPVQFNTLANLKLAYVVMLEKLKPDSFWKPYIDLLPDEYETVLYYTVDDMKELKGSQALSQALNQCKSIARQYTFIYNHLDQTPDRLKNVSPVGLLLKERFSYDLYRWAVSTVMTRENLIPRALDTPAHIFNGGPKSDKIASLIPFWDMANHKDGTVTSFFNMELDQLESSSLMDFSAGQQIFIYYGERSNADLLVHNGFINPTNPKDCVSIKLGLSTSDLLVVERSALLGLLKIATNGELTVLPPPEFVSSELLAFSRVFNMNPEQLDRWTKSDRATDLLHIDCALETSLEIKSWKFLEMRLTLLLRVFPTSLEEDEAAWKAHIDKQQELSHVKAMILQFRIMEKRILTSALEYARQKAKA